MPSRKLKPPFWWFGGKRRVAKFIWPRLGDVPNYVEPFFGSGTVLLARPHPAKLETVNDADGFVCNAWRAIAYAPDETAYWADCPVFENDLHARRVWLKERRSPLVERLEGDPHYFDPKIAGWWLWAIGCSINGGCCLNKEGGPWVIERDDGGFARLVRGSSGQGITRSLPDLADGEGRGVIPFRGRRESLIAWFRALSGRMARVRVCCGDWTRVLGNWMTRDQRMAGIFFDPPYTMDLGRDVLYDGDDRTTAERVRRWCAEHGSHPLLRIALCGYDGEHADLEGAGWTKICWNGTGYCARKKAGEGERFRREAIWFSPSCLQPHEADLFEEDLPQERGERGPGAANIPVAGGQAR